MKIRISIVIEIIFKKNSGAEQYNWIEKFTRGLNNRLDEEEKNRAFEIIEFAGQNKFKKVKRA